MDFTSFCHIWTRIPIVFYLPQSLIGRTIELELEDIHPITCFYDTICSTLALLLFRKNKVSTENTENQIEGVVEITFLKFRI